VGILKAKHNLPAGDPGREEAQIARPRARAGRGGRRNRG